MFFRAKLGPSLGSPTLEWLQTDFWSTQCTEQQFVWTPHVEELMSWYSKWIRWMEIGRWNVQRRLDLWGYVKEDVRRFGVFWEDVRSRMKDKWKSSDQLPCPGSLNIVIKTFCGHIGFRCRLLYILLRTGCCEAVTVCCPCEWQLFGSIVLMNEIRGPCSGCGSTVKIN